MQENIKLILKKNTLPISGMLILFFINYVLGLTLTEYSKNIILITLIVIASSGLLMYLASELDFNDNIKNSTYGYLSIINFTILTFFLYKDFLGSDNAFKLAYTILIFSSIMYISLKNIFETTSSIVVIGIVYLILKVFLIIIIIGTLSVAGLGI